MAFSERRELAVGDFEELNAIMEDARIELPETELSESLYNLRLYNIRCSDFSIEDILLWSQQKSSTSVEIGLELKDLSMFCQARYHFTGFLVNNRGDAEVSSRGNDAILQGRVTSANFMEEPPTDVQVQNCNPTININDMNFVNGGIMGILLNTAEGLLRDIMESIVEERICQELQAAMENVRGFLNYAKDTLDDYHPNLLGRLDPLELESSLEVPPSTSLLDLKTPDTQIGIWFQSALEQAVDYLGQTVVNPVSIWPDLQANILLRRYLLEDGALVINIEDLPFDGILFEGHDLLTETTIRMDTVRLVGLGEFRQPVQRFSSSFGFAHKHL